MRYLTTSLMGSALLAIGAPAQAASNLDCVVSGYSEADQRQIDAFFADFDHRSAADPMEAIEPVLAARVTNCAARHGWTDGAGVAAIEYQRASLIREGLRRQSPATPDGLAAMDAAIAATNPTELRTLVESVSGGRGAMNTRSLAVVLPIFRASGLPLNRESGEFVGAWIAATFAIQDRRILFANS